jgi:hypothetical protein
MNPLAQNEKFLWKAWDLATETLRAERGLGPLNAARAWFLAFETALKLTGYEIVPLPKKEEK